MYFSTRRNSLYTLKFSINFVLFFIVICKSNALKCDYSEDENRSVAFYCENFEEPLPVNCTTTLLQNLNETDKLKVIRLKVGGCDHDKVNQLLSEFPNLNSLDISQSGIESLDSYDLHHEHLTKFNASHNKLKKIPANLFSKLPNITEVDFSQNLLERVGQLPEKSIFMDLSHNRLRYIRSKEFCDFSNLKYLDLSSNSISIRDPLRPIYRFCIDDGWNWHMSLLQRDVSLSFSWNKKYNFSFQKYTGDRI